ncbi:MAG: glycosyltransferase [Flavobacteriaceae bacterium]|nr:glycosyltransferase [Flavobacteriaceae bacterium]
MRLSFIIPVFNAEKFLNRCVESIISQVKVDLNDYEIIAVNDGSTDDSGLICEKLKEKHSNFHYYTNENHGPGYTRNFGMKKAIGDYVWFVDSDDYLIDGVLSKVFQELKSDLPMFILGFQHLTEDGKEIRKVNFGNEILTPVEFLNRGYFINYVWCKVIKRSLLETNNILFLEDVITAEDFHLSFRLMTKIDRLKCIDLICYNYVLNPSSLMNKRSAEHMRRLADSTLLVGKDLRNELNQIGDFSRSQAFESWLNNYLYGFLFSLYRFQYESNYIKDIINQLKADGNYPLSTHSMKTKRRLFSTFANQRLLFTSVIRLKRTFSF